MSSPIAHSSLLLVAWPVVRRWIHPKLSRPRKALLSIALVVALCGPDVDVLLGPLAGEALMHYHNGFTHSLLLGFVVAPPFAVVCGLIAGGLWTRFAVLGFLAYSSHVLLDALTWNSGVQLLWPLTDARFSAPFPIFYGVRHSVNAPLYRHLITGANDLAFAMAVWLIARRFLPSWNCHRQELPTTSTEKR